MVQALITGAASLMGECTALTLGARGWDLILTDVNDAGLKAVCARIPATVKVTASHLDVTDHAACHTLARSVADGNGAINALVNCAGGLRGLGLSRQPLGEIRPEDWRRVITVNLKGVMNMVHAVLPVMRSQGSGTIVSIAASRGLRGGPGASHYSAAKAGVIMFTQTMVLECAGYGVRINTIAPGNADARWKSGANATGGVAPLGRTTSGDDVAKAVAWLVSEDASHVTGACIDVSGGTTLH